MECEESANVTEVQRTSSGNSSYECELCRKSFVTEKYLTNHMRTHTEQKSNYKFIKDCNAIEIKTEFSEEDPIINYGEFRNDAAESEDSKITDFGLIHIKKEQFGDAIKTQFKSEQDGIEEGEVDVARFSSGVPEFINCGGPSDLTVSHCNKNYRSEQCHDEIKTEPKSDVDKDGIEEEAKFSFRQFIKSDLTDSQCTENSDTSNSTNKCIHCKKSFSAKRSLVRHMKLHIQEQQHECSSKDLLKREIIERSGDKYSTGASYKCELCNKSLTTKKSLQRHLKLHTGQLHKCDVCCKEFLLPSALRKHIRKHAGPFNCDVCNKQFTKKENLHIHMKLHLGEKQFKCGICHREFSRKDNLVKHIRVHSGEKPFKCDLCDERFSAKASLVRHARLHSGEEPYKCDICERAFKQSASLVTHVRTHTGERPYKCEFCKKTFRQGGQLTYHIKTHEREKLYKCDICDKRFTQKQSLTRHIRIHTGDSPNKCRFCGEKFPRRTLLWAHVKSHTGEKPFKCDICGKTFSETRRLKRHIKVHAGEKPFNCDFCDNKFTEKSSVRIHIACVHGGEKPYKCDICDQMFSLKATLARHIRSHASEKPYECDFCDKKFADDSNLKRHNVKAHSGGKKQCNKIKGGWSSEINQDEGDVARGELEFIKCERRADLMDSQFTSASHECSNKVTGSPLFRHSEQQQQKCGETEIKLDLSGKNSPRIQLHTGGKPHKCEICEKSFSPKCHLVHHFKLHNGERRYNCEICHIKFTSNHNLKRHAKWHLGDKQ